MKHPWSAGSLFASITAFLSAFRSAQHQELESRLHIRAGSNVTIPSAISIGPSQYWDGNDGPWSSFPIQVGGGSTAQNVRVLPSTTGYNTWTIGPEGCPSGYVDDCTNRRGFLFTPNQSLTWLPNSIYPVGIEDNLGLDTTAPAGWDSVVLGWQGSGGPKVDHTVVFNVYSSKYWIGMFGLNPMPTNFSTLNNPQVSFMQSLYDNSVIPSRAYGYTAGNQYRLNKVFGSLTLGGYDENRFNGGVSFLFYTDISRDLLVYVKSISTGSNTNLLPDGQISAFIDSTVSEIWLPQSACDKFEQAFGLVYDSSSQKYLVNSTTHDSLLKSNPTVNFTLTNGTQDTKISLPYGAFNLNVSQPIVSNSSWYFPLQRAANDTQYTLGRAFLQEAYLIADYDRGNFTIAPCTWDQSKLSSTSVKSILSPNLTALAAAQQTTSITMLAKHSISTGAIVGIVVGVVVLVIAAVVGILLFLRRRRDHRRRLAELKEKGDDADRADTKLASVNELGDDGHLGELDAPYYAKVPEMESPHKNDPNRHGYMEMEGEYYGPGKNYSHEMDGEMPIYEMPGSDVHEMPTQRRSKIIGRRRV